VNVAPIVGVFLILLAGVWVYTEYLKPPTPLKNWQTIQNQWLPAREKDRAAMAVAATAQPFDLAAYKAAARAYSADIKGWADAVKKIGDWGAAANDMPTLQQYATQLQTDLSGIDKAQTVADIAALEDQLQGDDQQFQSIILVVDGDLGQAKPAANPSPILFPSYSPPASPSPSASPS
jgi:hypothetical protein